MAQSNTPLNADDELREELRELTEDIYNEEHYDELMRVIISDRKKHELQAKIYELNSLPHRSVTALTGSVDQSVIYERIDELKKELSSTKYRCKK